MAITHWLTAVALADQWGRDGAYKRGRGPGFCSFWQGTVRERERERETETENTNTNTELKRETESKKGGGCDCVYLLTPVFCVYFIEH